MGNKRTKKGGGIEGEKNKEEGGESNAFEGCTH